MEGRVEVCHNQIWWAVSGSYWDYRDATVVCRHLGYPADCKLQQLIIVGFMLYYLLILGLR